MVLLWVGINLKRSVLGLVNTRMRQVQRVGDPNDGGGIIESTPQSSVTAGGKAIAVSGSKGSGHGPKKHRKNQWEVRPTSTSVTINGLAISLSDDVDSCGHKRIGSSGIFIGR